MGHNPQRLESANRILEDPTFLEVMAVGKAQIIKTWADSKKPADREHAHAEYTAWARLPGLFQAIANSETIAEHVDGRKEGLVPHTVL